MNRLFSLSKALSDETRFSIYTHVCGQRQPVSVRQLAERFHLHPNAVRQHLNKLLEANLVDAILERNLPGNRLRSGRPKRLYLRSPEAESLPVFGRDFRFLSELLLGFISEMQTADELRQFGRRWGQRFATMQEPDNKYQTRPAMLLMALLRDWGFEAAASNPGHNLVSVSNCIFKEEAQAYPDIVCPFVDAVIDGWLSRRLEGFSCRVTPGIPFGKSSCELRITGCGPGAPGQTRENLSLGGSKPAASR